MLTNQSSEFSVLAKSMCILFFSPSAMEKPTVFLFELTKENIFEMHFGFPTF